MATFLLIHGSWHGAWCWDLLVPEIEALGHRSIAIDLPAHGDDRSFPWFATLPGYSAAIGAAAREIGAPVVGVGHSMGGAALSQAMADAPDLFSLGVLLASFSVTDGDSLVALAGQDDESLIGEGTRYGRSGMVIRPEVATELFYADCEPSDARSAISKLRPDPIRPLFAKFRSHGRSLPRVFIECTQDRAISIDWQRKMAERAGVEIAGSLEAGHSPFLSQPRELAAMLAQIAEDRVA